MSDQRSFPPHGTGSLGLRRFRAELRERNGVAERIAFVLARNKTQARHCLARDYPDYVAVTVEEDVEKAASGA